MPTVEHPIAYRVNGELWCLRCADTHFDAGDGFMLGAMALDEDDFPVDRWMAECDLCGEAIFET